MEVVKEQILARVRTDSCSIEASIRDIGESICCWIRHHISEELSSIEVLHTWRQISNKRRIESVRQGRA